MKDDEKGKDLERLMILYFSFVEQFVVSACIHPPPCRFFHSGVHLPDMKRLGGVCRSLVASGVVAGSTGEASYVVKGQEGRGKTRRSSSLSRGYFRGSFDSMDLQKHTKTRPI